MHERKPSQPSLKVQIFSSVLGDLAILVHLSYYYPTALSSFKDMLETKLHFPSMPPICALDIG